MRFGRFLVMGALASILMVHSGALTAATPNERKSLPSNPLVWLTRGGLIGLGFGFGPWWGPYDAYAPPAYAYPPPIYSVPPPPPPRAAATRSQLGPCREFESTVIVNGQSTAARGLACPQPDGSWRIVR